MLPEKESDDAAGEKAAKVRRVADIVEEGQELETVLIKRFPKGQHHSEHSQGDGDPKQGAGAHGHRYHEEQQHEQPLVGEENGKSRDQPKSPGGSAHDTGVAELVGPNPEERHLKQAAHDATEKVEHQHPPPTDGELDGAAEDKDGPGVEKDVKEPAVQELVGENLPVMVLTQTVKAEGVFVFENETVRTAD